MRTTRCGGPCGGEVVWVTVGSGLYARRVAVEPEPDDEGTMVIDSVEMEGTSLERYLARHVEPGTSPDRLRYRAHACGSRVPRQTARPVS